MWQCESDLNRHLLDRQSSALPLSYRTEVASDCCQPPADCRSPAGYLTKTQEVSYTPTPRASTQICLLAKLTDLHYPLSLTTHDVSLCRYPRGTRTRETGLAWYEAPGRTIKFGCYGWGRTNIFPLNRRTLDH